MLGLLNLIFHGKFVLETLCNEKKYIDLDFYRNQTKEELEKIEQREQTEKAATNWEMKTIIYFWREVKVRNREIVVWEKGK